MKNKIIIILVSLIVFSSLLWGKYAVRSISRGESLCRKEDLERIDVVWDYADIDVDKESGKYIEIKDKNDINKLTGKLNKLNLVKENTKENNLDNDCIIINGVTCKNDTGMCVCIVGDNFFHADGYDHKYDAYYIKNDQYKKDFEDYLQNLTENE